MVTVIGSHEDFDFDNAHPSPIMLRASRLWRFLTGTAKVALVAGLVGFYPAMMWSAHDIDAGTVDPDELALWSAPEDGVAISLIAREVEQVGWTTDRRAWHPATRLTAQPVWQESLMDALADFANLGANISSGDGTSDPDLAAASRLLRPARGEEMTPRLIAAAEALARHNGRADRGMAGTLDTRSDFAAAATLFARWAGESEHQVASRVGSDEAWPAGQHDVAAFYRARARAHVASNMLTAFAEHNPEIELSASLRAQWRETETLWQRISDQSPLMVSNQDGDGLILPNHLAAMAWHLGQAETASLELAELLLGAQPDTTLVAADFGELTTSP